MIGYYLAVSSHGTQYVIKLISKDKFVIVRGSNHIRVGEEYNVSLQDLEHIGFECKKLTKSEAFLEAL